MCTIFVPHLEGLIEERARRARTPPTRAGDIREDATFERLIWGIGEKEEGEMLKLPEVLGVAEARAEIAHMLEEVEKGQTFIIKGTKGREALVIDANAFRGLQEAYTELVGELETLRILRDERAMGAIQEASGDDQQRYTLSEVERVVGEDDLGGENP
jgi:hypothetical protein